jgi:hypothetical protein
VLLWLVLGLAVLYAGYWLVASRLADRALRGWFAERQADGWTASYDSLALRGFPSRFDVTVMDLDLRDPGSGFGWQAPQVEFDALSYQPQHYIATWPPTQTLLTPAGPVGIASRKMQASLVFTPGPSFRLNRSQLVISDLRVTPPGADAWGAAVFNFATDRAPATDFGHRIGLQATGLALPGSLRTLLDPDRGLPDKVDRLHLDAIVGFDAPWDRFALESGPLPQPTRLRLTDISAGWGDLGLAVSGDLAIGPGGIPEGRLDIRAAHWREGLDLLVRSGVLPPQNRSVVETALAVVSAASGGGEDLAATLTFTGGLMMLGALPLGPAPRLHLG